MKPQTIRVGLKFRSTTFSHDAEIKAIRPDEGKIDILFIPGDGHAWIEKDLDLNMVKEGFKDGRFTEIDPVQEREDNKINII